MYFCVCVVSTSGIFPRMVSLSFSVCFNMIILPNRVFIVIVSLYSSSHVSIYLFIWGFTSVSTLYRSYHDG